MAQHEFRQLQSCFLEKQDCQRTKELMKKAEFLEPVITQKNFQNFLNGKVIVCDIVVYFGKPLEKWPTFKFRR